MFLQARKDRVRKIQQGQKGIFNVIDQCANFTFNVTFRNTNEKKRVHVSSATQFRSLYKSYKEKKYEYS